MRKDQEAMTSAEAVQHIQAPQRLQQKNASGGSIEAQEYGEDARFGFGYHVGTGVPQESTTWPTPNHTRGRSPTALTHP